MPLIRNGARVADDVWLYVGDGDGEAIGEAAAVIVSVARWQRDRHSVLDLGIDVGIRLEAHEAPDLIADELTNFALIALVFPAFKDGRAFSSARLLRERYRFAGELRAVGNVLRDQAQFMLRCGFDTFEVEKESDVYAWAAASREMSVPYQPTGDGPAVGDAVARAVPRGGRGIAYAIARRAALGATKSART